MNRNHAIESGIKPATIDAQEYDIAQLVVDEEFGRKRISGTSDYRKRSIERLVKMHVPWTTEENISPIAIMEYIRIRCPYCGSDATSEGGSGSGFQYTARFKCECGSSFGLYLQSRAMSFSPPMERR